MKSLPAPSRGAVLGACLLAALALIAACATTGGRLPRPLPPPAAYPRARFVVISDPHVYDPGLLAPESASEAAIAQGGALYLRSAELFREAVSEAIELRPDFVLIAGDLTRDGEEPSHELVQRELSRLAEAGPRVYVVPGNHDVENPRAQGFSGGKLRFLPSPSRKDFARLYAPFGYGDALSRDSRSLSYVAQLLPGLRLLALDPFLRPDSPDPWRPEPIGAIGPETMAWIEAQLDEAAREGQAVIAMSHLSILEHFEGQAKYFPSSLPRERGKLASLLASHNVRLVFTGHFHIQDLVRGPFPGGTGLYDVATGSLANGPMPYRLVDVEADGASGAAKASIRSFHLSPAGAAAGSSSDDQLEAWMSLVLEQKLRAFFVPRAEAASIASSFTRAYLALAYGDENPAPGDDVMSEDIRSLAGRLAKKRLAKLLRDLWRDLPPGDNDVTIDL
jgi:3',5'-cyclic AMP phosphodiesterase CpdA